MNHNLSKFSDATRHMTDTFVSRLPALVVAIIVFTLFYALSLIIARLIRQATPSRRQNLGVLFGRLGSGATVLLGFLVAFSIVAPSFSGGGFNQGSWNQQRCHRLRVPKYFAELSRRPLATVD